MRCFLIFIVFSFTSCSFFDRELGWNDYVNYLNEEDNGLLKRKYINHLEITMQYLPAAYLVHSELKNDTSFTVAQKDSILSLYAHNLTFVLSIDPDERNGDSPIEDVLFYNIKNKEEYTYRMMHLNFDIKDHIELDCDDKVKYVPALTNMENSYGLSKGRKIIIVFTPLKSSEEFLKSKNITISWNDEVFETGQHYFSFDAAQLFSTPGLKL